MARVVKRGTSPRRWVFAWQEDMPRALECPLESSNADRGSEYRALTKENMRLLVSLKNNSSPGEVAFEPE